jgi:EAL domain-containing protein (putative c-di-GMP-specific phosphodiesterase class I)/GGDEF domain-containing protein
MYNDTDKPRATNEQRRDRRFQVSQPAIITQPGHTEIACEIRDFCFGGLFLRFTNPEAAIASLAKRADAEVNIVFTPASPTATQSFTVPAQLKRLSPLGVGVAFVRQPVEALRALQKLRMAGHRQKLTALPASAAHAQLREASSTLLAEMLQQVQDQIMRFIGDKLSAAAVQATGIAEHSGLLSAGHEFNRQAGAIQTRFVQQVMEAFKPGLAASKPAGIPGELALVDELDFEDWLATSSEANKLEEQFRDQLNDLEPRIGQLFGLACDHSSNPFGPAVIGHAYRTAIEDVPVLARARLVAYTTLREILSDQLAPLYAELLALLPVAAPAPASAHEVTGYPSYPEAHNGSGPEPSQDAAHPQAGGLPSSAVTPSAASPAADRQGALGRMAGSLLDFFRGQSPVVGAAASPAAASPSMSAAGAGGAPAGAAFTPGPSASAAAPAGTVSAQTGGGIGVAHSPVLQRLANAGALPPAVTVEMQRSVDMFGALFDTMHTEKSVSEGMKPFFHQLETSLIKLAMSDPQFLASPTHPAHKVLNTLDRISMVAGDDGKITDQRLMRLMTRWTDRIHAEAEKNPAVFDEARMQLERVVKPLLNERTARVFRLQEMCEGRQSAEVSKQGILRKLLARLDERPVPSAVVELLNGGWRNVLLMAEMRHGVDSEAAREAWQILQLLTAWLDSGHDMLPGNTEIQTLLQRVDQSLTQVCADKFAQDRLVDQLAAALFDKKMSPLQTTVSGHLDDANADSLTETQDNLVERLRVGDWLRFKSLDTPLNLIWIGDKPYVYVFANYRGIKKLDLKRGNLLVSLETGEAEWTEDLELPLMDRSYSAMIQKMQRDLVWQATHDPATGLANRKSFFRDIRRAWVRNPDSPGSVLAIVHLDIGSPDGAFVGGDHRNEMLREIAQALPRCLPAGALLARAGESSVAFWCEASDSAAAHAYAESAIRQIAVCLGKLDPVRNDIRPSLGLVWQGDSLHPETSYDNANAACVSAHETGVGIVQYRGDANDNAVLELAEWAHELTRILADNQFTLNVQPVVSATDASRTPLYHEVFLHPVVEGARHIETRDLITVAGRLQRITEIDRWVVRHVLEWMRNHQALLADMGGMSVSLSGQSINNPLFLKFILSELARGDVQGSKLIFEISEADAVDGHAQTQLFMRQLQRYGCRFTLDDFGGGGSSYTSLKSMKLDFLKLDRTLVRDIGTSMIDEALVRSILETGEFLELKTVAAFVEDEAMLTKLVEMGVDCVQGYLISPPRPIDTLAHNLASGLH